MRANTFAQKLTSLLCCTAMLSTVSAQTLGQSPYQNPTGDDRLSQQLPSNIRRDIPMAVPVQKERITNSDSLLNQSNRNTMDGQRPSVTDAPVEYEIPTEFQDFVYASTGQALDYFGYSLFRNVPSTFAPADRIPVTADYVVGPGDEILLRGWGSIDIDYRGIVDRSGNLFVPKVGNINVAGIPYAQLQSYIKNFIERNYKNFELNVSLGQLRSIQIYVVGQARRPGAYTVSALSTLVNALFASGGPSQKGSMRRIQLKRSGKLITEFDMYDLLLNGDKSKDVVLQPGDVIYIPPQSGVVAVTGSVNTQAIYEVKPDEALKAVLEHAGGLTPVASGDKVTVERITNRAIRSVEEFQLDNTGMTRPVKDGDLITVRSLSARFDNAIILRGNVANPGRYPWTAGERVKDLIPSRDALVTREFWLKQGQFTKEDPTIRIADIDLSDRRRNEISGITTKESTPKTGTTIGPLPATGTAAGDSRTTTRSVEEARQKQLREAERRRLENREALKNDIRRSGADINWDYAVVQRLRTTDFTTELIPFNLGKAIAGDEKENIPIQAGDVVTIFSQADLRIPVDRKSVFVRLEGEFNTAGVYQASPGETLRHLIERVGGLTPGAYLYGSELIRESTKEVQQQRLDDFVRQAERDVENSASRASQNIISAEEALGLNARLDAQRKLIEKLRLQEATGRVVLGIKPGDTDTSAIPEIALEDGDRFIVPNRPATVNVVGAVYNDNAFLHQQDRGLGDYLRMAGGATRDGDKSNIFLIRANGTVIKVGQSIGWLTADNRRLMPGDTIVVPQRTDRIGLLRGLRDWSQVFAQFAIGIAGVRAITRD
jgi:protein involved in polysaccharide export with SLBB domain